MAEVVEQEKSDVVSGENVPEEQARVEAAQRAATLADPADATLPARHRYAQSQVQVIRGAVAKDLNDIELAWFLEVSARYGLDPLLKEIFATKFDSSGGVTIFTGRDGMLKAAKRSGKFVRMESHVVREKDTFRKVIDTVASVDENREVLAVHHEQEGMGKDARGEIVGAYALVWTTDSPYPWYAEATWDEYGRLKQSTNSGKATTWTVDSAKGYPEAMMVKVPETYALRKACGLTGLVGEDEIAQQLQVQREGARPALSGEGATPTFEYPEGPLGERLQALVAAANKLVPGSWRPAKVAAELSVGTDDDLSRLLSTLERFIATREPGHPLLESIEAAAEETELPHVEWDPDAYRAVVTELLNLEERLEGELTDEARGVVESEHQDAGLLKRAFEKVMPEGYEEPSSQPDGPTEL